MPDARLRFIAQVTNGASLHHWRGWEWLCDGQFSTCPAIRQRAREFKVWTGFSRTSPMSTPDAVSTIRPAAEDRFNAAPGVSLPHSLMRKPRPIRPRSVRSVRLIAGSIVVRARSGCRWKYSRCGSMRTYVAVTAQLAARNVSLGHSGLAFATTTEIDFSGEGFHSVALTGDITFTTANLAPGRTKTIRIIGDASPRARSFPGGWSFVGVSVPPSLTAGKAAMLTLTSFATTDADAVPTWPAER